MANDDEFGVEIVTDLSDDHWDGIAQLYVDDEWFIFSKEMVEISKKFSWSKAAVAVNQKGILLFLIVKYSGNLIVIQQTATSLFQINSRG